jgi:hypothetical protein
LRPFTGTYTNILGELGTIELEGNQLRMHMKTKQVIDLLPLSDSEFALRWTPGTLTFKKMQTGAVSGFTLHLGGEHYQITRRQTAR